MQAKISPRILHLQVQFTLEAKILSPFNFPCKIAFKFLMAALELIATFIVLMYNENSLIWKLIFESWFDNFNVLMVPIDDIINIIC